MTKTVQLPRKGGMRECFVSRPGYVYCSCEIRQHVSHRGLGADGAKTAVQQVTRECYDSTYRLPDGSRSPLFGCRPIAFRGDEIFMEMPEPIAHLAAERLSTVMVEIMRSNYTPDVFIEARPTLTHFADVTRYPARIS